MLKFNYGQYWWNPSNDISTAANPNRSPWFRRYKWTDRNSNGHLGRRRTGHDVLSDARAASPARSSIPISRTPTRASVSAWFERELAPNFGVRTGVVMRQIRNQRTNDDANRPFSAFNVPATFPDPGPDGRAGTADDGPPISGFNLRSVGSGLPTLTTVANQPDAHGDYYTWEVSANRRMSGRWSLRASFTHTWNYDHGNSLRRQHRAAVRPAVHAQRSDQHRS